MFESDNEKKDIEGLDIDINATETTENTETAEVDSAATDERGGTAEGMSDSRADSDAFIPRYGINRTPGEGGYNSSYYGRYPDYEKEQKTVGKKKNRTAAIVLAAVLICLLFALAAGAMGAYFVNSFPKNGDNGIAVDGTSAQGPSTDGSSYDRTTNGTAVIIKNNAIIDYSSAFTDIVAAVKPSVVEINTESVTYDSRYGQYITEGAGSGVVIGNMQEDERRYYIATNNHVIDGAQTITVITTAGRKYEAELVGTDPLSDVALITVSVGEGETLAVATIGDSDNLLDGQDIIAVGNPLGTLGGSVTKGIVSNTARAVSVDGVKMTLLQIDAAINPGNSGGALFDAYGNLVGIVNAKYTSSSVEGLGFAIPINRAIEVITQLYDNGYVKGYPGLGMDISDQTTSGSVYATVTDPCSVSGTDSSGAVFSFAKSDIIAEVEGKTVGSVAALLGKLSEYKLGDTVKLTVYRYEKKSAGGFFGGSTYQWVEYEVSVTLVEYVPSYITSDGDIFS